MDPLMGGLIKVPQGHVWLVGDNLGNSIDSRDYGPVPEATLKGRILARVCSRLIQVWLMRFHFVINLSSAGFQIRLRMFPRSNLLEAMRCEAWKILRQSTLKADLKFKLNETIFKMTAWMKNRSPLSGRRFAIQKWGDESRNASSASVALFERRVGCRWVVLR